MFIELNLNSLLAYGSKTLNNFYFCLSARFLWSFSGWIYIYLWALWWLWNKWNICSLISKCWQGDYCIQVSKAFSWEGKESIHEQIINWIHYCHSDQSALPFFIQPLPSSASNFSLWFLWWQHCLHQQRWCSVYASHREQELRREFKINLQKKSHEKLPDISDCNTLSTQPVTA